jgi:hypothetical protein
MKTMNYIYSLPTSASFTGKGLLGYTFGPLKQKDLEIYYIEVEKGHDTFIVSKKIIRTYYVLSGSGYFTIADRTDSSAGDFFNDPTTERCQAASGKNSEALSDSPMQASDDQSDTAQTTFLEMFEERPSSYLVIKSPQPSGTLNS